MTRALHTLLEHAERQRDTVRAALRQAEQAARRLREQGEQLRVYRDEYRARSPTGGGRSATIAMLRCHQEFMQRLDQALTQQLGQQDTLASRTASLRTELLAHETRVASVRKLLERRDDEARRVAGRLEQRQNDESGQRTRAKLGAASIWGHGTHLHTD